MPPLERTLEPEIMDSDQEATAYDNMDHSEVNRQFVTDLLAFLEQDADFKTRMEGVDIDLDAWIDVLDVGTATAQIPIELCQRNPEFRVMAIDLAVSMLDLANYNLEANAMTHRVQLAKVDAKAMGYSDATFDLVMSNSIVHHLPDPQVCLNEIVRVVRPGGAIFVRDLMRPSTPERVDEFVRLYAGDESELCQQLFHASLHAALSLDEIRSIVASLGFDAQSVRASSDRHWTWQTPVN